MEGTIFSIIPALVMLILVLLTRRILLSLGTGIVLGALFIHDFNIIASIQEIWQSFYSIIISDQKLNIGNILLVGFLLFLGIMTALMQASGGSRAFGDWMVKRVKTRIGAQFMTATIGILIFIDDYFSNLAIGQISRPLTDKYRVSRAKLAYIIDSTSAPVTVLSPISSWGAYIIGILGGLFAIHEIADKKPLEVFIQMIPYNFYAIIAIVLVFLVIFFRIEIGPMKSHEKQAVDKGKLLNDNIVPGDLTNVFQPHSNGKVYHLFVPILVLIIGTVLSMFITGKAASEGEIDLISIFANTNVNLSLFIGGISSVVIAYMLHWTLPRPKANVFRILVEGCRTMMPAIYILMLAWMIGSIIGTLETGEYFAQIITNSSINPAFLPLMFFIVASVMALSTGTSWGTFGIMLPIAVQTTIFTDMSILIPSLAAVLAGSVFGDHCSPISDTTILSATGAGANHMDHVVTQIPYALIAAIAAGAGYMIIGFFNILYLSLLTVIALVGIILIVIRLSNQTRKN